MDRPHELSACVPRARRAVDDYIYIRIRCCSYTALNRLYRSVALWCRDRERPQVVCRECHAPQRVPANTAFILVLTLRSALLGPESE